MINKKTINEILESYLKEKGLDDESIENIKRHLNKDIKNYGVKEEKKEKITKTVHGTSCPRILNKYGELVIEM